MYSHCLDAVDCPGLGGCLQIGDPATDGFCTVDGCPVGCDPAPGEAPVTCLVGATYNVCALDCSGGEACPVPMVCSTLTGGTVCV
jgi:hypothetical protein